MCSPCSLSLLGQLISQSKVRPAGEILFVPFFLSTFFNRYLPSQPTPLQLVNNTMVSILNRTREGEIQIRVSEMILCLDWIEVVRIRSDGRGRRGWWTRAEEENLNRMTSDQYYFGDSQRDVECDVVTDRLIRFQSDQFERFILPSLF